MPKRRSAGSGGPPSLSDAERKLRVWSLLPIELEYDPFEDAVSLKRLLADLASLVLQGRLHHRAASAVRLLVLGWIAVDEHQRLDAVEARLTELENRHD